MAPYSSKSYSKDVPKISQNDSKYKQCEKTKFQIGYWKDAWKQVCIVKVKYLTYKGQEWQK